MTHSLFYLVLSLYSHGLYSGHVVGGAPPRGSENLYGFHVLEPCDTEAKSREEQERAKKKQHFSELLCPFCAFWDVFNFPKVGGKLAKYCVQ